MKKRTIAKRQAREAIKTFIRTNDDDDKAFYCTVVDDNRSFTCRTEPMNMLDVTRFVSWCAKKYKHIEADAFFLSDNSYADVGWTDYLIEDYKWENQYLPDRSCNDELI